MLRGKALLIASGGGGTLYGFTTYSQTVTGDGMAMAYRAGLPLEDMEFLQFHPTGLVPDGILMTEACRGEGGYLQEQQGRALHGELRAQAHGARAARHGLARRDRGDPRGPRLQDARRAGLPPPRPHPPRRRPHQHASAAHPRGRIKFLGLDPITTPIPIRPVAHYSMGGIETDINGLTRIAGHLGRGRGGLRLAARRQPAGLQLHGGVPRVGRHHRRARSPRRCPGSSPPRRCRRDKAARAEDRIAHVLARQGEENLYELRRELRATMDAYVGVFRNGDDLAKALRTSGRSAQRAEHAPVADKSRVYNSNLFHALELENLLDLAEVTVVGALARQESRGAHARRDFADARRRELAQAHAGLRTPAAAAARVQAGDHRHVEAGRAQVLAHGGSANGIPRTSESAGHPRAGSAAGAGASSATCTRCTASPASGLLAYFLLHIFVTSPRVLGPAPGSTRWRSSTARSSSSASTWSSRPSPSTPSTASGSADRAGLRRRQADRARLPVRDLGRPAAAARERGDDDRGRARGVGRLNFFFLD